MNICQSNYDPDWTFIKLITLNVYDLFLTMTKGFEAEVNLEETPILNETADKPLKSKNIEKKRVDINVLKARAKSIQDKENAKNTFVLIFFLLALGTIGIYFSI